MHRFVSSWDPESGTRSGEEVDATERTTRIVQRGESLSRQSVPFVTFSGSREGVCRR